MSRGASGAAPSAARTSPRILVIDAALKENGGTRVLVDLAGRWQRAGAPTELFVMQKSQDEAAGLAAWASSQVQVRYGSTTPGRLRNALGPICLRFLAAARRSDLILSVCEDGNGVLLGAAVAKLLRMPFAAVVHTPVKKAVQEWTPKALHEPTFAALRSAALLVCVAEGLVETLTEIGVQQSRIRVIRNGMDVSRVLQNGAAEIVPPLPAQVGRPLIVAVGRLTRQKGFDLLLQAHAQLLQRGLHHHLAIVGEGPERPALEAQIAELRIGASVHLLGFLDNPHALMARADLFCMPSRYEGYPLALIEALALGVPILASRCVSGPSEVLADGAFGDLVEVESVPALVEGIARHLRDPARLHALAAKGPERARGFDPDKAAADYLTLFDTLAGR